MIRSTAPAGTGAESEAGDFWLFTQHDHALLSGELARHVGGRFIAIPKDRRESFIRGTSLHDVGWPVHDDEPTLNEHGEPIDVFESTPQIALKVWTASSERAVAAGDDYAALLVSLHVLSLSVNATAGTDQKHETFDTNHAKTRFAVNQFQHNQIELQESLRRKLNLPVDEPMRQGLVESPQHPGELLLQFHFRLLQAMDQLSLGLCCTKPPTDRTTPLYVQPGGRSTTLSIRRTSPTALAVSPWPFDVPSIEVSAPYRRVPQQAYADETSLRAVYAKARVESVAFALSPA